MTTVDAIYIRHERSLMAVDHADDVVLFSLRLALEELAASTNGHTPDRQAERDRDTLAAQVHELTAQLGTAKLRIMELEADLSACREAATWTVQQLAPAHAIIHSGEQAATTPPNPPPAPLPLDLSSLAPDELQQVAAVQSGERLWRTLPKPLRVKVASLTLRQLAQAKGERITQEEWDTQRPPWLPSAGSLTYMYGQKWHEIPQE